MGNPLKKTMVYLGLADEEEVYEEKRRRPPALTANAIVTARSRHRPPSRRFAAPSPSASRLQEP